MKKILFVLLFFSIFKSANAQLEFYQIMFNVYSNGERTTDTRRFDITFNSYDRETGNLFVTKDLFPGDTAKNLGYDYNIMQTGDLLFERIAEIILINGTDSMKIIFDDNKASAWTSLGIDKLEFIPGTFKLTKTNWPQNRRDRPMNNRYFPFVDEDFNWEKIRIK